MTTTKNALAVDSALLRQLQALADENRLRILEVLRDGERCVCELQDTLELAQSLLSHHLRSLREAGLVKDRREGRWVHYSLSASALLDLAKYFESVNDSTTASQTRESCCTP